MLLHSFGYPLVARYVALSVFVVILAGAAAGSMSADSSDRVNKAFWKSVYQDNHVVAIDITLSRDAWMSMQPARSGRRERESEFNYVRAEISLDGELLKEAGLRFKGNSSYRSAQRGFKRPFKIDTNRFVKGHKFYGCTKLNLSNSYLDSAFMKEKLGCEVYRAAGIPTPGVGWAMVSLTIEGVTGKQSLGIYVIVEQVDEQLIRSGFGEASKGSLLMKPEISSNWGYSGAALEDYELFGIKINPDDDGSFKRFGELLNLIHSSSDRDFVRKISRFLDLDQFSGYLAATSLLANIDSYIGMPHNYYLLVDRADDRVRILPWDLNESFGTFTMGSSPAALADWDIDRPWVANLKLLERLFAMEDFRERYRSALMGLLQETFSEEHLFARISEFENSLAPHLNRQEQAAMQLGIEGDASGYNTAVERRVFAIKPFIAKRVASVRAQLAGQREGTKLSGRGRAGPRRGRPPGAPQGRGTRGPVGRF